MATTTQIINLRLEISDPFGVIAIASVATANDLPATPRPQTAYRTTDTGLYYRTEKTSGAVPADYATVELQLSDDRISTFIDDNGEGMAIGVALRAISKRLAAMLPMVSHSAGAESVQYQSLLDLYKFYKSAADDADAQERHDVGIDTGVYARTHTPRIAGGDV